MSAPRGKPIRTAPRRERAIHALSRLQVAEAALRSAAHSLLDARAQDMADAVAQLHAASEDLTAELRRRLWPTKGPL